MKTSIPSDLRTLSTKDYDKLIAKLRVEASGWHDIVVASKSDDAARVHLQVRVQSYDRKSSQTWETDEPVSHKDAPGVLTDYARRAGSDPIITRLRRQQETAGVQYSEVKRRSRKLVEDFSRVEFERQVERDNLAKRHDAGLSIALAAGNQTPASPKATSRVREMVGLSS